MPISLKCSVCGTALKVTDDLAGKKCKCPKCATVNVVPVAEVLSDELEETATANETATPKKKGKGKQAKKGGSKKGLVLGGVAALLFLGCLGCGGMGGGFALWYFWGGTSDVMYYLPNGTTVVEAKRREQMYNSKVQKEALHGFDDRAQPDTEHGLIFGNIDRIVMGSVGDGPSANRITVIVTLSAADASDICQQYKKADPMAEYAETKVGGYKMMERKGAGTAFCVVSRKTVIYGSTPSVRTVLERDKAPDLSPAMQAALRKADFSNSESFIYDLTKGNVGGVYTLTGIITNKNYGSAKVTVESVVLETHYSDDVTYRQIITFSDAATAETAKKEWESSWERLKKNRLFGPSVSNATAVNAATSGNTLTIEWHSATWGKVKK